jgi:glycosyltransferase involved in cell wall biosynthesis
MTDTTGKPKRCVLHFVTGGFSGATQVAVDLALASLSSTAIEPLLVLRRKRNTDLARVQALRAHGLRVWVVPGWSHLATVWALRRLCQAERPEVLVAHGFPEHLLGRWAGLWAGVPKLVQVEHNTRERYSAWRLAQARWLAGRSARLVGVSEGVRQRLIELGMPAALTAAIPNGIELGRFAQPVAFEQREPAIVMSARFARQKDQLTLIRALGLLKARGLAPTLKLAGAGKASYRQAAEAEVLRLGLVGQVQFLGHHADMPGLLMSQQLFVLATHWEGMPLALVEAMAAGCACVASKVPGVEGLLDEGRTGLLVPESDAAALADAIEPLLRDPALAARLGAAARERAMAEHGLALMTQRYEALLLGL